MPTSSAEQMRQWRGPALLSYGFRPFFLFGALWAGLAMVLWVLSLADVLTLPSAFDPVSWHAHAFLFGYLPAIVAGFMLTAVPNWTGRLPVVGIPLGVLFTLWLLGRLVVLFSGHLPALLVALVDLSALVALATVMAREIIAGKNWRNLIVLAMLALLILGNAVFHFEAAREDYPAQGFGLRIGLAAGVLMISVIGGRIVPSFTRNWLVKSGSNIRPAPPMQKFDKLTLLYSVLTLVFWVAQPDFWISGWCLIAFAALHFVRLSRWGGIHTLSDPLLWVLHLAYGFIPLGALALGVAILWLDILLPSAAQHVWMAGAISLMTLAVMARATLGHTGNALTAGPGTVAMFLCIPVSVLARLAAGIWPDAADHLYHIAGASWILGFFGFVAIYGTLLLNKKLAR